MAVALLAGSTAHAKPGDLDPSFGTGGIVANAHDAIAGGRLLRSDVALLGTATGGKPVLAGVGTKGERCDRSDCRYFDYTFFAERRLPDGGRDLSFGGDGRVETNFGLTEGSVGPHAALQPDGGVVVLGSGPDLLYVFRLQPNGLVDEGFAGDGRAELPFSAVQPWIEDADITVQSDGRVVVAATSSTHPAEPDQTRRELFRLHADGTRDLSFQPGGPQVLDVAEYGIAELVTDSHDRVLLSTQRPQDFAGLIYRYTADGASDGSFGEAGAATLGGDSESPPFIGPFLAIAPDDSIFATWNGRKVARVEADGDLDPGFGGDGVFVHPDFTRLTGIASVPEGGVLIAAANSHPETRDSTLMLGRLTSAGVPDPAFGRDGFATTWPELDFRGADLLPLTAGSALAVGGQRAGRGIAQARFRLGSGEADDLDADGVLDPVDRCAGRYEPSRGCPVYSRRVTLKRLGTRRLRGTVKADSARCFRRLELKGQRKGRDPVLATVRVDLEGSVGRFVKELKRPARGPVYAKAPRELLPEHGICRAAVSRAVRPKHR